MATPTEFAPGTPCWVELSTSDVDAAKAFYREVLGWDDYEVAGPEAGNYTMPARGGKTLAGMMTQMDDEKKMGVPPHWNTYIRVQNADDTAKQAKELGGTVAAEPFDVMEVGRMAVIIDPVGAAICIWQPNQHPGFGIVREPGTFAWAELDVSDTETAKGFYTQLFGWRANEHKEPVPYTEWQLDGESVGGMLQVTPEMGPIPPNWQVFFEVPDADAAVAKAKQAGGQVLVEPMDVPAGRFAVIADPQGAVFSVIKSTER